LAAVTTELTAFLHAASTTSELALLPSAEDILHSMGAFALLGACLIIFAECGLLIGFFLPGDSLLFVLGLFVATGGVATPLWLVCALVAISAFAGNVTGYWIGRQAGPALFNKPDSKLFKREYVDRTHDFFDKYGPRAIILGRFVPIVRTFITAVAGIGRMDPRRFFTYSAIGAVGWAAGVTVLGYFLGNFTFIKNNIDAISVLIVVVSVIPIVIEYVRTRREKREKPRSASN
jgi:membrane-associated protein